MVSPQIAILGAQVATLGPGEGPVLALDFLLPANGYLDDALNRMRLINLGTAGPSEIEELRLWRDGGDGTFSAASGDDATSITRPQTVSPGLYCHFSPGLNFIGCAARASTVSASVP